MRYIPFVGLMAAPFTPLNEKGDLNLDMVPLQAEHLLKNSVKGVFVAGTTGECQSLTLQERMQLAQAWSVAAKGRLTFMIHVGHNSAREARELAKHAKSVGADAISSAAPCFFKPSTPADLVEFQAEVASAAPELPFYHYHIPLFTGVNGPVAPFLRMASKKIPNLVGVKYSHSDLSDLLECTILDNGRFEVLFGCDEMLLGAIAMGVRGAVGSTYNFAASIYLEMMEAFEKGDVEKTRLLQEKSVAIVRLIQEFGGIPGGKALMGALGVECGPVRPPLHKLTKDEIQTLRDKFMVLSSISKLPNPHAV
jgi:N-acetylneuraminate lyase